MNTYRIKLLGWDNYGAHKLTQDVRAISPTDAVQSLPNRPIDGCDEWIVKSVRKVREKA